MSHDSIQHKDTKRSSDVGPADGWENLWTIPTMEERARFTRAADRFLERRGANSLDYNRTKFKYGKHVRDARPDELDEIDETEELGEGGEDANT